MASCRVRSPEPSFRMSAPTERIGPAPRIAVTRAGSGPLLVLMHGIGGNRSNWTDQLPAFAQHFTTVAWDARGYGDSDDYADALRFEDFSADLKRVLDHYGVERAHLLGISMGGRIAIDFCARQPARVATLVVADTSAGSKVVASPEKVDEFLALRKAPLLNGKTPADIAPNVAESLASPATTPAVRARMIESLAALHCDSYLKTLDTVTRYTAFPDFASIKAPALVLAGEYDRIATPDHARDMASQMRARFVVLPHAGHMSNMENPSAFNAAALEFLLAHRDHGDAPRSAAARVNA